MQDLVAQCVVPELSSSLYLYTAPPKQVLTDLDSSLYAARLVPAAHIYMGLDVKKGRGWAMMNERMNGWMNE